MIRVNYNPETSRVIGFNLDAEPFIEITEEQRNKPIDNKYGYYAVEDGQFVIKHRTPTADELLADTKSAIEKELAEIKNWYADNDYKVIKLFLGEWQKTDTNWITYLAERAIKRKRQIELEEKIDATNKSET